MLPLPPLRTHRAPFNAIGSSISKAFFDEETRHHESTDFTIICGGNHLLLFMSAPARPKSAVICLPMSRLFTRISRDETPVGSRLSFDMKQILNLYPHHYSLAFAFSNILYPLHHWLVLRPSYPKGAHRAYPVPLVYQSRLEPALSAVEGFQLLRRRRNICGRGRVSPCT